jgi:hypothetical protein
MPVLVMIRLRGDRQSLLMALLLHWSEQQLGLPLIAEGGNEEVGKGMDDDALARRCLALEKSSRSH